MSKGMYAAGLIQLALGVALIMATSSERWALVGVVIGGLGGLALGVGFCLEQIGDPVEEEVERWDRSWSAVWSPVCPVHGAQMCITKTGRCPDLRRRAA